MTYLPPYIVRATNFLDDVTKEEIRGYFSHPIKELTLCKSCYNYFAIIEFETRDGLLHALSLSGKIRTGHYCPLRIIEWTITGLSGGYNCPLKIIAKDHPPTYAESVNHVPPSYADTINMRLIA